MGLSGPLQLLCDYPSQSLFFGVHVCVRVIHVQL